MDEMAVSQKIADEVASKAFSRHSTPEHFVANLLENKKISNGEVASIYLNIFAAIFPELDIRNRVPKA
jgi:hypothetical protein